MKHRGRGEGSITHRADGRWSAIISLGWQDGKRKRRTIYGRTREAVAKALTATLRSRDQGLPVPTGGFTVAKYLARWLEDIQSSIRPRTYEKFESVVRLHIVPDLGRIRLEKLTPDDVQGLLNRKLADGFAPQSVRHIRTILSIALRKGLKKDLIGRNVAALTSGPKVERAPLKPLTEEGAQRFLDIVSDDRLEALFVMALTVAMRRGEILGVKWADINMETRELDVKQSLQRLRLPKTRGQRSCVQAPVSPERSHLELLPLKTKSSTRPIRLPEQLFAALKRRGIRQKEEQLAAGADWQGNPEDLVFTSLRGTPMEPRNVVRMFKIALERAGLPDVRFHDLRHTCATLLFKDGAHPKQVQVLLGHSRVATTLDIYTHVDSSTLDDTANRIDAILGAVKARA